MGRPTPLNNCFEIDKSCVFIDGDRVEPSFNGLLLNAYSFGGAGFA
jgi:hypothetical protein